MYKYNFNKERTVLFLRSHERKSWRYRVVGVQARNYSQIRFRGSIGILLLVISIAKFAGGRQIRRKIKP